MVAHLVFNKVSYTKDVPVENVFRRRRVHRTRNFKSEDDIYYPTKGHHHTRKILLGQGTSCFPCKSLQKNVSCLYKWIFNSESQRKMKENTFIYSIRSMNAAVVSMKLPALLNAVKKGKKKKWKENRLSSHAVFLLEGFWCMSLRLVFHKLRWGRCLSTQEYSVFLCCFWRCLRCEMLKKEVSQINWIVYQSYPFPIKHLLFLSNVK